MLLVLTPGLIPVDSPVVRECLGAALPGCTEELEFGCQVLGKGLSLSRTTCGLSWQCGQWILFYLQKADQFIRVDRVCYKQLHLLATSSRQSWGNVSLEDLPYLGFIVSLLW